MKSLTPPTFLVRERDGTGGLGRKRTMTLEGGAIYVQRQYMIVDIVGNIVVTFT